MKRSISKLLLTSAAVLSVSLMAGSAMAQDAMFGKAAFRTHCAMCHGEAGLGDGQIGQMFTVPPGNLQVLAKANNGAFPFSEVYQAINGVRDIRGHGGRDMPVWGNVFRADALPYTIHPGVDPEEMVQSRILALVYYLQTVQQ